MNRRDRRPNLHVLHVGKTGGTAIRAALEGVESPRFRLHFPSHGTRLTDLPPEDLAVAFVRDPAKRFVSGFYSRQRCGRPRYHVPWSEEEARAFGVFSTPDQLACALSSGDSEERDAALEAMSAIQHVRDPQVEWYGGLSFLSRHHGRLPFVGALERLGQDYEALQEILEVRGFPLPTDPVDAHRNPPSLSYDLSHTAAVNLRMWYSRDYDLVAILRRGHPHLPVYT